jgi:hypothetical protein
MPSTPGSSAAAAAAHIAGNDIKKADEALFRNQPHEQLLQNAEKSLSGSDMVICVERRPYKIHRYVMPEGISYYYGKHADRPATIPPAQFVDDVMRGGIFSYAVEGPYQGIDTYHDRAVPNERMDRIEEESKQLVGPVSQQYVDERNAMLDELEASYFFRLSRWLENDCCLFYYLCCCCFCRKPSYVISDSFSQKVGYLSRAVSPDGRGLIVDGLHSYEEGLYKGLDGKKYIDGGKKVYGVQFGTITWQGYDVTNEFHRRFALLVRGWNRYGESNTVTLSDYSLEITKAKQESAVAITINALDPRTPLLPPQPQRHNSSGANAAAFSAIAIVTAAGEEAKKAAKAAASAPTDTSAVKPVQKTDPQMTRV